MKKKKSIHKSTLKQLMNYMLPYKWLLFSSVIMAILSVIFTLYVPVLTGKAIDTILGKNQVDFPSLSVLLLKIATIILLAALTQWIMNLCNNKIVYQVTQNIRKDAFQKIQVLPYSYLDRHAFGEIISRIITDVDQLGDGLLLGFTQLFTGIITIFGTLLFMISIDIKITLMVVLITPISLLCARFISNKTHSMFRLQSEYRADLTAFTNEIIENQKVVKAYSHEEEAIQDFDCISSKLEHSSLRAIFFSSLTNPLTRFINSLVYTGVGLIGGITALNGGISIGNLFSFLSYTNQYAKPLNEISGVITEFQNSFVCASRTFELINETPEIEFDSALDITNYIDGYVSMHDVNFSYDPNHKLIENFNLEVRRGQKVAIVGPTGCGKTTIINLLVRFYDVNEGSINVSGFNLRDITKASLRTSYGMVLQETWLKSGTIRDNIILGKPDATEEEIITAAKASHAHSFIKRLSAQYDTLIGEDGGNLSQGQKQLLCITRVMLCLPPMLILDEATSSIDTRTELMIQKAFQTMMKGRTSFIVAHRLSTIQNADIILVMDHGKIIELGDHTSLLKEKGFYYHMYQSQFASTKE